MRFAKLAALAGILVVALAACETSIVFETGSGDIVTESRDVSGFDEILLKGSGSVRVNLTGTESLRVEADDNLMDNVTTEVHDGVLELSTKGRINLSQEVVYTVTAARLDWVTIEGSGTVVVEGLDNEKFSAEISGSGEVVASGVSDDLAVFVSGSGRYEGADLTSRTGLVDISGSGRALVNVTDELEAEISGSGEVEYIGDPSLNTRISGSGDISRR